MCYLLDMNARLVRYAQDRVTVPTGVPTTPTRTVWKPKQHTKRFVDDPHVAHHIKNTSVTMLAHSYLLLSRSAGLHQSRSWAAEEKWAEIKIWIKGQHRQGQQFRIYPKSDQILDHKIQSTYVALLYNPVKPAISHTHTYLYNMT